MGTTCRLESNTTSAGGETFNEPTADNIIGKTLVLYPHLSKYEIGGYNNSTREITLAAGEQFIGEDENATTCHIVDRNTTGYILKVTQLISDGGSG